MNFTLKNKKLSSIKSHNDSKEYSIILLKLKENKQQKFQGYTKLKTFIEVILQLNLPKQS